MKRFVAVIVAISVVPLPAGAAIGSSASSARSPGPARLGTSMSARPLARPAGCDGEEPPRGVGMIVTGGVLMGPVAIGSVAIGLLVRSLRDVGCVGGCDTDADTVAPQREQSSTAGLGLFVFGGLAFIGGATLLGVGLHRNVRWRRWRDGQRVLTPGVGRTALGTWTPGLTLRF